MSSVGQAIEVVCPSIGYFGRPDCDRGIQTPAEPGLGLLQRVLLSADGTVTSILEAYAGEPVGVVKLAHVMVEPGHPGCPELDLTSREPLLRRTVLLQGRRSQAKFLHAEALIAPHRLHRAVRDDLLLTDTAIGPLLAQYQVETYKEVLGSGQEPAGAYAPYFGVDESTPVLVRTSRVFSGGLPIVVVTERFPTTFA